LHTTVRERLQANVDYHPSNLPGAPIYVDDDRGL